jgi:hypothetical protein
MARPAAAASARRGTRRVRVIIWQSPGHMRGKVFGCNHNNPSQFISRKNHCKYFSGEMFEDLSIDAFSGMM